MKRITVLFLLVVCISMAYGSGVTIRPWWGESGDGIISGDNTDSIGFSNGTDSIWLTPDSAYTTDGDTAIWGGTGSGSTTDSLDVSGWNYALLTQIRDTAAIMVIDSLDVSGWNYALLTQIRDTTAIMVIDSLDVSGWNYALLTQIRDTTEIIIEDSLDEYSLTTAIASAYLHATGDTVRGDLLTDQYEENKTNTFLGVDVAGAGNLDTSGAATYGRDNTAIGNLSLFGVTAGYGNTAIGYSSLQDVTTGSSNVAIGAEALLSNTAANNTAIGYRSLYSNVTGYAVTAVGHHALYFSTATRNTAVGNSSLQNTTSGGYNVGFGSFSGMTNTTGTHNVFFGPYAGYSNETNDSSIFIGSYAGYYETNAQRLYISNDSTSLPLIYGEFNRDTLVINGALATTGQLKVGAYTLPATDGTANYILKTDGSGAVSWAADAGAAGGETNTLNDTGTFNGTEGFGLTQTKAVAELRIRGLIEGANITIAASGDTAYTVTAGAGAGLDSAEVIKILLDTTYLDSTLTGVLVRDTGDLLYQPLEATLTDIADGTIAENLVNTAHPWTVAEGGTGAATFTSTGVLFGNSTGAFYAGNAMTEGQLLIGNGIAYPSQVAMSGDATMAQTGVLTIAANAVESTMVGADQINDLDINFGTGTDQVSATDMSDFGTMTATSGNMLVADGTDFETVTMSGDATIATGGALTIAGTLDSTNFGNATIGWEDIDTVGSAVTDVDTLGTKIAEALADRANIHDTLTLSFVIIDPAVAHDFPFRMMRKAVTIVKVSGVCIAGTNVVGCLMEYDANGATPVTCESDADWTFTTGEEEITTGTDLDNPSIDANDYLGWKTTSVSGEVTSLTLTVEYTVD